MNNCLIAQSGGPTAVINASLAGVISDVIKRKKYDVIYGLLNGIEGIFESTYINLTRMFETEEKIDLLVHTPAMYLGSCRFKLPDSNDNIEIYEKIFSFFLTHHIKTFFYIGGNDSMDTVAKLADYAKNVGSDIHIIGIPKTIDNDLYGIDHTPGFGSAAKYVATSILEIAFDAEIYKLQSVTIVEIMGRDAGWLTAAAALARNENNTAPQLIYLPEVVFDPEEFITDLKRLLKKNDNIVVAVSEGIRGKDGKYISAIENNQDIFGHSQLNGVGKTLERLVRKRLGIKVRSVEINVLQRCASHLASETDVREAFELGKQAVKLADKETAVMASLVRKKKSEYCVEYGYVPIYEVANKVKNVPEEYISKNHNDVTEKMIEYLYPLIQGESSVQYVNGLPNYIKSHARMKNKWESDVEWEQ